jgi:15-cis-phytoene synthase
MQADPERALALDYAPAEARAALHALFALDDTLAQVLRTTTEPVIGQMRLTWWHDALAALDTAPPPAQPVLQALADTVLPRGASGAMLAEIVGGWDALIETEAVDAEAMRAHAEGRGARLFAAAALLLGRSDPRVAAAGRGWALADLSRHLRSSEAAREAAALAEAALAEGLRGTWPAPLRALGALARIARMNLAVPADAPIRAGAPRRVARLMFHRITGR